MDGDEVGHTYTRGRRQPYLVRKWPGSDWALPMGPYTITQLVVFVGSVYLLLTHHRVWAHFGALNVLIGVGVPVALTYATRHTRLEGRDPLRAAAALAGLLLRPAAGHLGGAPVAAAAPVRLPPARFPVAAFPAGHARSEPPAAPPTPPAGAADPPAGPGWVPDLVARTARTARAA